jgi:hypothetical protein
MFIGLRKRQARNAVSTANATASRILDLGQLRMVLPAPCQHAIGDQLHPAKTGVAQQFDRLT